MEQFSSLEFESLIRRKFNHFCGKIQIQTKKNTGLHSFLSKRCQNVVAIDILAILERKNMQTEELSPDNLDNPEKLAIFAF